MRGRLSRTLWIAFALFIVYGSAIPFNFTTDRAFAARKLARVSLNPLISPDTGRRVSITDVVQNVLFFVPFGSLGILAGGRRRGLGRAASRLVVVTILAALLGTAVEAMQLFTLDRVTSLTDVIAETTGAFLGAAVTLLTWRTSSGLLSALARIGLLDLDTFYPMLIAALVVFVAAWEPFDVTLDVGSVVSKLRMLHRDIWQAGALTDEALAAFQYALFMITGTAWLERIRWKRAAVTALAVGLVLPFCLEASQIVIFSRMPSLEDAVVRAGGSIGGILLWPAVRDSRRPAPWVALVVLATAVGAAMQQLSPFEIAPYHAFEWAPFFSYYVHTSFETVSHVIELLLTYFPLGFVVAWVSRSRRRALLAALAIAFAIAAPVEYMQGWIVGRYPDITDLSLGLVGAWFGVWVATTGAGMFTRAFAVQEGDSTSSVRATRRPRPAAATPSTRSSK